MNERETRALGIRNWTDLATDFAGSDLLLGNGFSVSISNVFTYDSLFAAFYAKCAADERSRLDSFRTTNFEFILEDLGTAERVNRIFEVKTEPIGEFGNLVREGLITTIEDNHPRADEIDWNRLRQIAVALDRFGDIYTLNYDALIYHVIMICRDRHRIVESAVPYNDYFWNRISEHHLQFMDYQNIRPYKHIYYLHGALFLFKTFDPDRMSQVDVKLCTDRNAELLSAIAAEIRAGSIPLFVSEGTSEEKERAIARSDYLHFANAHLKDDRSSIVIYGASLGDQDQHIAEAVRRGTTAAAVSLYLGEREGDEVEREMHTMRARLAGMEVAFFDSSTLFS